MKKFAQTSIRPKGVGKTVFESIMNTNVDKSGVKKTNDVQKTGVKRTSGGRKSRKKAK